MSLHRRMISTIFCQRLPAIYDGTVLIYVTSVSTVHRRYVVIQVGWVLCAELSLDSWTTARQNDLISRSVCLCYTARIILIETSLVKFALRRKSKAATSHMLDCVENKGCCKHMQWWWLKQSQTAAMSSILNRKWSEIRIQIFELIRIADPHACLPDGSQNAVDSLRPVYSDTTQLNSTAWTTVTDQFWTSWPSEGVCSDATQLDVELSWVELRRYRHRHWVTTFRTDRWQLFTLSSWVELRRCRYRHFADATQLNSTSSGVELSYVAINGP